jgi:acyl-CoA synthetase (AMP-forming)/AMP-acid ligase II
MALGLAERIKTVLALGPDKGALEFNGAWHSWEEIGNAMQQLDDILASAGLGEGTPVGIVLRNRPAHFPALLEVLVSRRCVVTINPFQSAEKLANDVRGLRLRVLIADGQDWTIPELQEVARELGCLAIQADTTPVLGMKLIAPAGAAADQFDASLDGTCILMLTSGTTGPAKRIKLPYRHFERAIFDAEYYETKGGVMKLELKETPAVLATPLVHIGGMYAAVAAVASARPIVILEKFSVAEFRRVLAAYGPKLIALPPTAVRMILDADVPKAELACLRAIRTGSAPLDPALQEAFEAHYGVPLLDAYGATEFAGAVAGWTLKDHTIYSKAKRGSVGRAQPGCQLRVVCPTTQELLPAGSVGLLEVKTSQSEDGAWLRTTDLAEIDADGFLFIRGRADDAIVRGGFKVLPRDVEAIFRKHSSVKDASVVGLPDQRLGAIPVVAIELREDCAPVTTDELLAFARKDLASYQVPVHAMVVKALPRSPSLKVSQHEVRDLFLRQLHEQVA